MQINNLLFSIQNNVLVLPEFQREYVWLKEQAKRMMVSLIKEYPIGSLLFWSTVNPPELKKIFKTLAMPGTTSVILDGQQRLTTLYMLMRGDVPPFYDLTDIKYDPRDLYFNIDTGDFQYYQKSVMLDNPIWQRVVDCFTRTDINVFEIAAMTAVSKDDAFILAKRYNQNLTKLQNIKQMDLPVQTVPNQAEIGDAINIFDWINSQGTKLTDAELALTHMTGKWADARRTMKKELSELRTVNFNFDLNFLTRAMTILVAKRALFPEIHDKPKVELVNGWAKLKKILDYLVMLLPSHAICSTEDLGTTNVLIPWVAYLAQHDGKFSSAQSIKQAIHWLLAANMWGRYSAQTDQRLEYDCSIVFQEDIPWKKLTDQIIDQRGRIDVKANDLEGRGIQHPMCRMAGILVKTRGAEDWITGVQLGGKGLSNYSLHSHHIFPQAYLYKNGYDPENHLHQKIVNEIANRAYLLPDTNHAILDKPPYQYLPSIEEKYPGALERQFVPTDHSLWTVENYESFLEARRMLIAQEINEFMNALLAEQIAVSTRLLGELIPLGESANVEFKSSLQWDLVQKTSNKALRQTVLRTIAAFLNSMGGTLVIGVEDNKNVFGIEQDLQILENSRDKFEQLLINLIGEFLGPEYSPFIKIRFEDIDGKTVCGLDVIKAPQPVYLKGISGKEFYIRFGNTTRQMDPEETVSYIQSNWD